MREYIEAQIEKAKAEEKNTDVHEATELIKGREKL